MIPKIKEINFPAYATLSSATATLNDMGERTITAQVKISGDIVPDFSYDWEVEFQGERYIQPLREPQASKGNDSICSIIDLTFHHKTIYDLKRFYFVKMVEVDSNTATVDKYIADLAVNLETFCVALQQVLDYYYNGAIRIDLKDAGQGVYAKESHYIQLQYTHIWDVLQRIYDLFGVRWIIVGNVIKIGYPTEEVAHTFKYGFEGGLLKVERQVQSVDIRNSLLGRGGDKNLPYRYFKDADPDNPDWSADPDWIPELANIYFTELRGKTFRDYVKGWKAKHYGGEPMSEPTEAYTKGFTDEKFDPVENVEDKESIAKYGLLQGGLENQEDKYPSIQGVVVEPYGRIDEVVGVERILADPNDKPESTEDMFMEISATLKAKPTSISANGTLTVGVTSDPFVVPEGKVGRFTQSPKFSASANVPFTVIQYRIVKGADGKYQNLKYTNTEYKWQEFDCELVDWILRYQDNGERVVDITRVESGRSLYVEASCVVSNFAKTIDNTSINEGTGLVQGTEKIPASTYPVVVNVTRNLDYSPFNGIVLSNTTDGFTPITTTSTVGANSSKQVILLSDEVEIPEDGATALDSIVNILAYTSSGGSADGFYTFSRDVKALNLETNELVSSINFPKGRYKIQTTVTLNNNANQSIGFEVQLLPTWVLFASTADSRWLPTFDIWVKNIWGTTRNDSETEEEYANRVWRPILGDRLGNEAKAVFTSGFLSSHSDYEFTITDYAYDTSAVHKGVTSEWRLTLAKSDAELEATGMYIPNASTGGNAIAGDTFFFIGIDMPHQYVLWAEQALDDYKREKLADTAHIKPTWVVQVDKVRLHQAQEGDSELLLDSLRVGNSLKLADSRFISGDYERLYLQSVTYSWQNDVNILPNVEVVLSDKVAVMANPVAEIQGEVEALTKQVNTISNIQQAVRSVGDKLYLRKDGLEDESNSPTRFAKQVTSKGYQGGIEGGQGWACYVDEDGNGVGEFDVIRARKSLQVNELVVNQITAIGGKEILSAARIEVSRIEDADNGIVCYFDTHNLTIGNLFQVDDVAYSQMFDENDIEIKYYKRRVVEVGTNYITLSRDDVNGDGAPQVSDIVVHFGNYTDPSRQYVIIRDVIGGGYERMLSGLTSVSATGEEYYFAGRELGGTPRWFVGDKNAHARYQDGVFKIKGQMEIGSQVGDGMTLVDGGAILSETITLKQQGTEDSAGISGIGDTDDSIRFWAGGTFVTWYGWRNEMDDVTMYSPTLPPAVGQGVVDLYYDTKSSPVYTNVQCVDRAFSLVGTFVYDPNYNLHTTDAPFRVTKGGDIFAESGFFGGGLVVKYTPVTGAIDLNTTSQRNFIAMSSFSTITLPNDTKFIGTVLNLTCPIGFTRNASAWTIRPSASGTLFHPRYTEANTATVSRKAMKPINELTFSDMGHIQLTCLPPAFYDPDDNGGKVTWMVTQDNALNLLADGTLIE